MAKKIVRKKKKEPAPPVKKTVTKKTTKKASTKRSSGSSVDVTQFLVPGVVAFLIVWFLSHSVSFAGFIFLAVLIGNWFGQTYRNRK